MGLSSSQGRLLMLTSRLSDIEFSETILSQRQNQLAMSREAEAKAYMEATNNYKITINVTDPSTASGVRNEDLNYNNMTQMGYLVTNVKNQIYLKKDESGNWIIPKDIDGNEICSVDAATGKATVNGKEFEVIDGTESLSNKEVLQNAIINGTLFVLDTNAEDPTPSKQLLESDTAMQYILDTSDDAEAESKHEYELSRLARQENQIEMEMGQLETQHEAILKEYESVKKVITNNVDRTFKLFSSQG